MKRYLIFISFTLMLAGCTEVFAPDVEVTQPFLIIEGSVTTKSGEHFVYLSSSKAYSESAYFNGVSGAVVNAIDDAGNEILFTEIGKGVYRAIIDEESVPQVGESYFLRVITLEGDIYESTMQPISECSEISKLYSEFDLKQILTEDTYGKAVEVDHKGMNILFETRGIENRDNYYIYDYLAFEQQRVIAYIEGQESFTVYGYTSIPLGYQNFIHAVNAKDYGELEVRANKLLFLSQPDMLDNLPELPDSYIIIKSYLDGVLFKLIQHSVSAEVYSYYSTAEEQLNAEGRLFDPVSAQLEGNIKCISDSTKKVQGIFYASDATEKYAYFYLDSRNIAHTRSIDSLPEIHINELYGQAPEGWIEPGK